MCNDLHVMYFIMIVTYSLHKVGCKRCGKHYTCEDDDDCKEVISDAYCWKLKGNLAGWCYWRYPTKINGGWTVATMCCET